jgi:hypothetical protein
VSEGAPQCKRLRSYTVTRLCERKMALRIEDYALILETEFQTESGSAAVVDFMAFGDRAHLLRIVMGRVGRVDFRTEFVVRFNYGSTVPCVTRLDDGAINAIAGPERIVLHSRRPAG